MLGTNLNLSRTAHGNHADETSNCFESKRSASGTEYYMSNYVINGESQSFSGSDFYLPSSIDLILDRIQWYSVAENSGSRSK